MCSSDLTVLSSMLYTFDDSRDSHDWNGFTALTGLNARASGTSVETQVPLFDLGLAEGESFVG